MTVLVTGATGSIGQEVLAQLLRGGVDVCASSRNPAAGAFPTGVGARAVDLAKPDTLAAALDGVDAVYLFPTFDDPEGVAGAIAASDVSRLVLLSSLSTAQEGAESQFNASRFLRIERALESIGIPFVFLRAGEFAGNITFYAPGIADGKVQVPFLDSRHLPIDERDIAEVAVIGLTSDRLAGRKPVLTGEQLLTLREEIEIVAAALGRDVEVTELAKDQALESFIPQAPRPLVERMLDTWESTIANPPQASAEIRSITGHAPRPFAEWARDSIGRFG